MMVYKYRLTDPDSGKVLYEGTAILDRKSTRLNSSH